jgi:HAD superfamily hydrolase (TIGR01509 family)
MRPIPVKAILSDAGNILYDDRGCGKAVHTHISRITGIPEKTLRHQFAPYRQRVHTKRPYHYAQAWYDFCQKLKLNVEQTQQVLDIYRVRWGQVKLYPGVRETISKLKQQNIDFIIITDSPESAENMDAMLKAEGLSIDGIVSSKDIGVTKPHRRIFDAALLRYGLDKNETVFLAHDYDELRGAHDLGYRVLALNYEKKDNLGFIPPCRKLGKFSELLRVTTPMQTSPERNGSDARQSTQYARTKSHPQQSSYASPN